MKHPIAIGKLGSAYGVHGWLRVHSYTDPIDNIIEYQNWQTKIRDQWQTLPVEGCKRHGKHILVKFSDCDSPEQAKLRVNQKVWIERDELAATEADEYYWSDLIGCEIKTTDGTPLGIVDHMLETGSNDVFVIEASENGGKRRLIPHIEAVITSIDIDNKLIIANWDPDY
ncbi:MAG: ribosome maturation factor RimM [Coxiellaceae bacterium]|nr:ribosome maturation factor RimM [Coxiellaceae bacterium]